MSEPTPWLLQKYPWLRIWYIEWSEIHLVNYFYKKIGTIIKKCLETYSDLKFQEKHLRYESMF